MVRRSEEFVTYRSHAVQNSGRLGNYSRPLPRPAEAADQDCQEFRVRAGTQVQQLPLFVISAEAKRRAGIQNAAVSLDSRFRGNDG